MSYSGALIAKYKYDALGRRYEKELASGTLYVYTYSNQDIIQEDKTQSGVLDTKEYIYGLGVDDVEVMIWNGARYGYIKDRQGSIRGLVDSAGNIIQVYRYDAYGNILENISYPVGYVDTENTRMYTGREYDSETGLYYYRARYYDSSDRRFLEQDPLGGM